MAREYQNGDGFGYILAFRKKDTSSWTEVRVPRVESSRHVYYNSSLAAYTPFEVKIKAYNRKGEGPFSQVAVVHSAEEGEYRWRSANSTTVWSLWQMSSPVSVRTATLNGCSDRITALYRSSLWWMFVHTKMSTVVHCKRWSVKSLWAHLYSVLFKWHEPGNCFLLNTFVGPHEKRVPVSSLIYHETSPPSHHIPAVDMFEHCSDTVWHSVNSRLVLKAECTGFYSTRALWSEHPVYQQQHLGMLDLKHTRGS